MSSGRCVKSFLTSPRGPLTTTTRAFTVTLTPSGIGTSVCFNMVFCECVNTVQRSRRSARGSLAQGAAVAAAPERRRWRHKEKLQIDGGRKPLHERASTSACLLAGARRSSTQAARQRGRAAAACAQASWDSHHCRRRLANCDRHLHEGTLSAHLPPGARAMPFRLYM